MSNVSVVKLSKWLSANREYLIYVLCTFGLGIIAYFRTNGNGATWAFTNELVGVVMLGFILARIGLGHYKKLPFIIVLSLEFIAFIPLYYFYAPKTDYSYQFIARCFNVLIYSAMAIRLFFDVKEGKLAGRKKSQGVLFYLWLAMIFFCLVSRNESLWPILALTMYGLFYLYPIDDSGYDKLLNGIVDGAILTFFVFQTHAFLFCPYDIIGYIGFFSNSDVNAKFYTIYYVCFLVKYSILNRRQTKKKYFALFFAGAMCAFAFFTIMRSAVIGMGLATIAWIVSEELLLHKNGILGVIKRGVLILGFAIVSLPLVYISIRYIPALRHHPIFNGTYSEDRVHAWDPIDSEKYVSIEEVLSASLGGKFSVDLETPDADFSVGDKLSEAILEQFEAENGYKLEKIAKIKTLSEDGERVLEYEDGIRPGKDAEHPCYIQIHYDGRWENMLGVRKYIFKSYLDDMKWFGNRQDYPSYWTTCERVYTSAHCSYIDFASRYGYIAGILYCLFIILVIIEGFVQIKRSNSIALPITLTVTFAAAYMGWGLFYSVVFPGELMDSLFWIIVLPLVYRRENPYVNYR